MKAFGAVPRAVRAGAFGRPVGLASPAGRARVRLAAFGVVVALLLPGCAAFGDGLRGVAAAISAPPPPPPPVEGRSNFCALYEPVRGEGGTEAATAMWDEMHARWPSVSAIIRGNNEAWRRLCGAGA